MTDASMDLISQLRKLGHPVAQSAADCIEQLQMPPEKVRKLAGTDEGADNLAMIRALCKQVEGQRKHIATLETKLKGKTFVTDPAPEPNADDANVIQQLQCRAGESAGGSTAEILVEDLQSLLNKSRELRVTHPPEVNLPDPHEVWVRSGSVTSNDVRTVMRAIAQLLQSDPTRPEPTADGALKELRSRLGLGESA